MNYDLPLSVTIDGKKFEIEKKCDYRVILDCINVYEDNNLDLATQHQNALMIFYKEPKKIKNVEEAIKQMIRVIDCETEESFDEKQNAQSKPPLRLMSWEKDFKFIAPPVSRVLGYDVRTPNKYLHWWSFYSAFLEIGGECFWQAIISIRKKRLQGKPLDEWERQIYEDYKNDIDLPQKLTNEEEEWLNSDW
jgi:hypothetical protein